MCAGLHVRGLRPHLGGTLCPSPSGDIGSWAERPHTTPLPADTWLWTGVGTACGTVVTQHRCPAMALAGSCLDQGSEPPWPIHSLDGPLQPGLHPALGGEWFPAPGGAMLRGWAYQSLAKLNHSDHSGSVSSTALPSEDHEEPDSHVHPASQGWGLYWPGPQAALKATWPSKGALM
jgi:hypothetical protein